MFPRLRLAKSMEEVVNRAASLQNAAEAGRCLLQEARGARNEQVAAMIALFRKLA